MAYEIIPHIPLYRFRNSYIKNRFHLYIHVLPMMVYIAVTNGNNHNSRNHDKQHLSSFRQVPPSGKQWLLIYIFGFVTFTYTKKHLSLRQLISSQHKPQSYPYISNVRFPYLYIQLRIEPRVLHIEANIRHTYSPIISNLRPHNTRIFAQ